MIVQREDHRIQVAVESQNGWDQHVWIENEDQIRIFGEHDPPTEYEKKKKAEMDGFTNAFAKMKWTLKEVVADGNCLFRVMAFVLKGDTRDHGSIRGEVSEYMASQADYFKGFMKDGVWDEQFKEYAWASHVTVAAICELYNIKMKVYEFNQELKLKWFHGEYNEIDTPIVTVSRHNDNHYKNLVDFSD